MHQFNTLRKMRILLIDDDEWIRGSLQLFFEAEGCQLMNLKYLAIWFIFIHALISTKVSTIPCR